MTALRTPLLWTLRITGILQVVLGLLFWTGRALDLTNLHMMVGIIFVLAYLGLVALGARAIGGTATVLAVLFGLFIPYFGIVHPRILLGPWHHAIRAAHLLVGMAAMGIADRVTKPAAVVAA